MTGRTGGAGVGGGVVSRTIVIDVLAADLLPAESVTVASTVQVPSVIAGRSQLDTVADLVNVHDTVDPSDFFALIVT